MDLDAKHCWTLLPERRPVGAKLLEYELNWWLLVVAGEDDHFVYSESASTVQNSMFEVKTLCKHFDIAFYFNLNTV